MRDKKTPSNQPTNVQSGGVDRKRQRGSQFHTVAINPRAPGEYLLQVTANDYSGDGGGGEVCCWTNTIVSVTVTN